MDETTLAEHVIRHCRRYTNPAVVNSTALLAQEIIDLCNIFYDQQKTSTTMQLSPYSEFIERRAAYVGSDGFSPLFMPDWLFDFQQCLVEWNIRRGRSATFADCGMGKTPMQLVWAQNVVQHTNKSVLILTPLAVAAQTVREAEKFGIEAARSSGEQVPQKIVVANYERLHKLDPFGFIGVVCDESSCLKAMDGKRRAEVTEFLRRMPYRLLCTATAAPNDFVELGTASEAVGEMGQRDMITMFFRQETKKDWLGWGRTKYRMKGHAEAAFWRWVCSWARACRKPSDLGFSDERFVLPPLTEREHVVQSTQKRPGFLFDMPARDMQEEREERRRTINERCEKVAEIVSDKSRAAVIWCHLNDEGDLLSKLIPDGEQVKGSDSLEAKEERYAAFASGELSKLIIKPKIGAWGLNWQHCNHVVTFASHSYEQYYQAIRRCLRFGQTRPVDVDFVVTEGEQRIAANLERKTKSADRMFTAMVAAMNDSLAIHGNEPYPYEPEKPSWL